MNMERIYDQINYKNKIRDVFTSKTSNPHLPDTCNEAKFRIDYIKSKYGYRTGNNKQYLSYLNGIKRKYLKEHCNSRYKVDKNANVLFAKTATIRAPYVQDKQEPLFYHTMNRNNSSKNMISIHQQNINYNSIPDHLRLGKSLSMQSYSPVYIPNLHFNDKSDYTQKEPSDSESDRSSEIREIYPINKRIEKLRDIKKNLERKVSPEKYKAMKQKEEHNEVIRKTVHDFLYKQSAFQYDVSMNMLISPRLIPNSPKPRKNMTPYSSL